MRRVVRTAKGYWLIKDQYHKRWPLRKGWRFEDCRCDECIAGMWD